MIKKGTLTWVYEVEDITDIVGEGRVEGLGESKKRGMA